MENDINQMIRDRANSFISKENIREESLRFWKSVGYTEDDKDLAVLLDNQLLFNNMATENKHGEFLLKLVKQTWNKLNSKKFVSFSIMTGPTRLVYSTKMKGDSLVLEEYAMQARTRKFETLLRLPCENEEEEITILDKDTFEPSKKKYKVEHAGTSECDLLETMSNCFAQEIDNEIITDLLNNATGWAKNGKAFREVKKKDNIIAITNNSGSEISKSYGFDNIIVNEIVGNNILLCEKIGIISGYHYCPYVFIAPSPKVIDPQGFIRQSGITRYGKKLTNSNYYCKISF